MNDPIADKLEAKFKRAQELIPDLEEIALYVANKGEKHVIIASAPNTTELEDGTVLRTRLPIFWGLEEECYDMLPTLQRITDWTLKVH